MSPEESVQVISVMVDEDRRATCIELSDGSSLETGVGVPEVRGISPGLVLSSDQVEGLQEAAERKRAARQVFTWLDRRPRTRADLRRRLLDRDFRAHVVEKVLDRFEAEGLVDDREFALEWSRQRLRNRPVGPRWLSGRLRTEGVAADLVYRVVAEVYAEFPEPELARRALERRRLDLSSDVGRKRAERFLASRGFGYDAVRKALAGVRAAAEG